MPTKKKTKVEEREPHALMTLQQVCDLFDISPTTANRWIERGRLPKPIRCTPRTHRFRRSEIERALADMGDREI